MTNYYIYIISTCPGTFKLPITQTWNGYIKPRTLPWDVNQKIVTRIFWSGLAAIMVNGVRKQRRLVIIIKFEFYFTGGIELCIL